MLNRDFCSRLSSGVFGGVIGFVTPICASFSHLIQAGHAFYLEGFAGQNMWSNINNFSYSIVLLIDTQIIQKIQIIMASTRIGARRGFHFGWRDAIHHMYEYAQQDFEGLWMRDRRLRGENMGDIIVGIEVPMAFDNHENQALLDRIDSLTPADNIALLDAKETARYQEIIELSDNKAERVLLRNKLGDYKQYIENRSPISFDSIHTINLQQLITIEGKRGIGYSYDLESLREHIQSCTERGIYANEPVTGVNLTDEKATFIYRGYSKSMIHFIHDVRAAIMLSQDRLSRQEIAKKRIEYYSSKGICHRSGVFRQHQQSDNNCDDRSRKTIQKSFMSGVS